MRIRITFVLNEIDMSKDNIDKINEVITEFFKTSSKADWVPAKLIMPDLIKAGVFIKDEKNGMPLRRVFRELDKDNELTKIPNLHAERSGENTYWYLVREGATYIPKDPNDTGIPKGQQRRAARGNSDEYYLINLCDDLLSQRASRQHKFGFILGDLHKDEKTRTALPVDAYYKEAKLVLEFLKIEDDTIELGKPGRKTISGVDRAEQRKIYASRKRKGLDAKDIPFIEIDFTAFELDSENNLARNNEADVVVLKNLLKDFL
jgi:hypothetical protein